MRDALLLMVSVTEDEKFVTNRKVLSCFPDLFIIAQVATPVKPLSPIKNPLAGASALSEYSRKYLTCRQVSANRNYKSKHSEATVKNLSLGGKSEFHFFL